MLSVTNRSPWPTSKGSRRVMSRQVQRFGTANRPACLRYLSPHLGFPSVGTLSARTGYHPSWGRRKIFAPFDVCDASLFGKPPNFCMRRGTGRLTAMGKR
jgi:hypothetical protein